MEGRKETRIQAFKTSFVGSPICGHVTLYGRSILFHDSEGKERVQLSWSIQYWLYTPFMSLSQCQITHSVSAVKSACLWHDPKWDQGCPQVLCIFFRLHVCIYIYIKSIIVFLFRNEQDIFVDWNLSFDEQNTYWVERWSSSSVTLLPWLSLPPCTCLPALLFPLYIPMSHLWHGLASPHTILCCQKTINSKLNMLYSIEGVTNFCQKEHWFFYAENLHL